MGASGCINQTSFLLESKPVGKDNNDQSGKEYPYIRGFTMLDRSSISERLFLVFYFWKLNITYQCTFTKQNIIPVMQNVGIYSSESFMFETILGGQEIT